MHYRDGQVLGPLQLTQERQQLSDIAGVVLVSTVQPHQRVENEQARLDPLDGLCEPEPIVLEIESQTGGGDDVDGDVVDLEAAVLAEPGETLTHQRGVIFGKVHQGVAGLVRLESVETRSGGGDREGEIEPEPGLAELRRAADEADGRTAPELVNEPARSGFGLPEIPHTADRQRSAAHG